MMCLSPGKTEGVNVGVVLCELLEPKWWMRRVGLYGRAAWCKIQSLSRLIRASHRWETLHKVPCLSGMKGGSPVSNGVT